MKHSGRSLTKAQPASPYSMYSGGHSGYGGSSTPAGTFQAGGFVPASSLAGAGNPFTGNSAFSQPAQPNPFQSNAVPFQAAGFPTNSSFSSTYPNSDFPAHKPSTASVSNSFATPFQTYPSQQGFQGQYQAGKGTAGTSYKPAEEREGSQSVPLLHICSTTALLSKSTEELRLEDYQQTKGANRPAPHSFTQRTDPFRPADPSTLARPAPNPFSAFPQSTSAFPQTTSSFPQPASSFSQPTSGFPQPNSSFPQPTSSFPQPTSAFPQPSSSFPQSTSAFPQPNANSDTFAFQSAGFPLRAMGSAPTPTKGFQSHSNPFASSQGLPAAPSSSAAFPASTRSFPPSQSQQVFPIPPAPTNFPAPTAFPAFQRPAESTQFPTSSQFPSAVQTQCPAVSPTSFPKQTSFQPQPALPTTPYSYSATDVSSLQGYRDHLGLSWLFPNGVPDELKAQRQPSCLCPSVTEELLRKKDSVSSRVVLDKMSEHWRRSKVRQVAKPLPEKPAFPLASVFSRKPFRELNLKAHSPPHDSPYELKPVSTPPVQPRREKERGKAPRLTRSGYYTVPSAQELERMSGEELRRVQGFTVGNADGKVEFSGETDVEGLELDSLVQIEARAVVVYPESTAKPPVSSKLNKPATITLYHCTPKSASDPALFERRVRKVCEKSGAEFLSYDAQSGEWVFRVEHF